MSTWNQPIWKYHLQCRSLRRCSNLTCHGSPIKVWHSFTFGRHCGHVLNLQTRVEIGVITLCIATIIIIIIWIENGYLQTQLWIVRHVVCWCECDYHRAVGLPNCVTCWYVSDWCRLKTDSVKDEVTWCGQVSVGSDAG